MGFRIPRRLSAWAVSLVTAVATATSLGVIGLATATPAGADTNVCPASGTGNLQVDNLVGATSSVTGSNTLTYYFSSFANENSSGGIPGLIAYCIFPSPANFPDATTTSATGQNGAAWNEPATATNFGFVRPAGDPSNIALDGTTNIEMGTATWTANPVPDQVIILHVNDPATCSALYGSGTLTCFVLPGTGVVANKDLSVTKTATPSFTRTFTWNISKAVDQTEIDIAQGGSATFNYTVSVTHDNGTDSAWQVAGDITVSNPNSTDFTGVNVTDQIDNGGTCQVQAGSPGSVDPASATIPASGTVDFPYACSYGSAPNPSAFKNTATASWDSTLFDTPDSTASGSASGDFSTVTPTLVDDKVSVSDPLAPNDPLGTASYTDQNPIQFTYSHSYSGDPSGTCTKHDNTATFTTDTSGTTGSASQTVKVCVGADLTVSKDATPSFTRSYTWDIAKKVNPTLIEQAGGGTAAANYTVNVDQTGFSDRGWTVQGTITVSNPNDWESVTVSGLTDAVDNGGSCAISGTPAGTEIPESGSAQFPYTCTYNSAPASADGTNTATATWDAASSFTPDGSASGDASFAFTTPTTTVNQTITPQDAFNGGAPVNLCTLDLSAPCTLTASDDLASLTSQAYHYSRTLQVPSSNCITYNNTATIKETLQSASASVEVCGPAKTGALTMGFWQNKNGQGIITGQAKTGTCPSATWLRQYAPFGDLSATATCSQVAAYVYNVVKAASAGGSTMNPMLKAQMLATALDVYFSDSSLGGNKIGAPAAIGGVVIDLTKICQMTDGSGSSSCSGNYENVSSAFGGATSLSVSQILAYAASQSNSGGSTWYGNVKATQQLAKDTFDAINNQVAFAP